MKIHKQFVNILEDNIHAQIETSKLIKDHAQYKVINHSQSIIWDLFIDDRESEPHCQQQNLFEHHFHKIKHLTNTILDCMIDPDYMWLIYTMHMCFLSKHTYNDGNYDIPINNYTDSTMYIGPVLRFRFCKPVHCKVDGSDFLSDSTEKCGRWVGIAEHVGHAMMFKIFTDDTHKALFCSNLCSAE